jgi:hypothetical protein
MKSSIIITVLSVFIMISCKPTGGGGINYSYPKAIFPDTPVNMGSFNSEYDDYNMASPVIGNSTPLCFSSNRTRLGKDFDIIYKLLSCTWDQRSGVLNMGEISATASALSDFVIENNNINYALQNINTFSDELGPYMISRGMNYHGASPSNMNKRYYTYLFLYASNQEGNLNIYYTNNSDTDIYTIPKPVTFLNSNNDDVYPCLNQDSSSIYFCSNRSGNFDIYKVDLNPTKNLLLNLCDTSFRMVTKDANLSSTYDDKCPYIMGNLMVFTSNRPGGFGGYDLYYSTFSNGQWSAPVNFGNKINTAFDEYRPVISNVGFENNLMLFSSNRPGGKGGFDLYYVGVKK